ncbi:MAG: hypothetical protein FGF53_03300 [Candidatus Brockarchaeota archaeon]|nr:hypothetical protein [Candidatus Brockarchaeota archaeon]MBO3808298.1 hypothetical protein [Candidatus Brockarchaeota archaeon]MBO3841891.1 hypothetical protein [Candidatus Brockarchaeota archaeon]
MKTVKEGYVLDSTAIIQGVDPNSLKRESFTIRELLDEIGEIGRRWIRIKTAMMLGKLVIREPSAGGMEKVERTAKEYGLYDKLSKPDIKILALGYELHSEEDYDIEIITDDYDIQNTAAILNLKYISIGMKKIRKTYLYVKYCPACKRKYSGYTGTICPVCGYRLIGMKKVIKDNTY